MERMDRTAQETIEDEIGNLEAKLAQAEATAVDPLTVLAIARSLLELYRLLRARR